MTKRKFVRWGIFLGLLSMLVRALASPEWLEQYYSRGFFPLFRSLWDNLLTSWFPFALIYLLAGILLLRAVRAVIRWNKLKGVAKIWSAIWGFLGFSGWTIALFLMMWGYNYGRVPVEQRLGLQLVNPSPEALVNTIQAEVKDLAELRVQIIGSDTAALQAKHFPVKMEQQLSQALEAVLAHYNYPVVGKVRGRVLAPKGIFLRFSTAGLYLPWTGEGHIDGGLIHLQRPYTLAHELAHGYGFGDEGSCSFWAYLTAFRLQDPALKYAIRLGYWRSLAANWSRRDPEAYLVFRSSLPAGIVADLEAINTNNAVYPDILPAFRDAAYDSYLKAQGIGEGMENYGKVVLLVEAWRKQEQQFFIKQ